MWSYLDWGKRVPFHGQPTVEEATREVKSRGPSRFIIYDRKTRRHPNWSPAVKRCYGIKQPLKD